MKTAVCFYGLVGTTDGKSSEGKGNPAKCFQISSPLQLQHIIEPNNADVFIHSWSTDLQSEILETYEPKKHIIEKQIKFDIPSYVPSKPTRCQTHYSLWYSRQQSVKLKKEYEQKHDFKYDYVMINRFDLAWQNSLVFEEYNPEYFWVGKWPKKILQGEMLKDTTYWKKSRGGTVDPGFDTIWWGYPHSEENGILGMWFMSNSQYIDEFATLYNYLDEYSKPGNCPTDYGGQISAHLQCTYHLKQLGLLDKLKFVNKNWHDDFPSVRRKYYQTR